MDDNEFKQLHHLTGNHPIASRGQSVSNEYGYKPDVTAKDSTGSLKFILESEQKTDRKMFLGDVIKAEMHAERTGDRPALIIVMAEFSNTTVDQIANHLRPYVSWLKALKNGNLNLSRIQVISDVHYQESITRHEALDSAAFLRRGRQVL